MTLIPSLLLLLAILRPCFSVVENQDYWHAKSMEELETSLNIKRNEKQAKNVVLFIGDGMGPNTIVASRIYHGGESSHFTFEKFPHVGLLKTYNINKQVTDSASSATAIFTGVKTNQETVGVDSTVSLNDCKASLKQNARLQSISVWALEAGKAAGFVTNTRVTHATPSSLYAHSASRKWECEDYKPVPLPPECKDIARQLVEDFPGNKLNVIMGGGYAVLDQQPASELNSNMWECNRKDGRLLTQKWINDKKSQGLKHAFVRNNEELRSLDLKVVNYLMGIFAKQHMVPEYIRDDGPKGMPSLREMTTSAIKVLNNNKNGFVLMVEGGLIDLAHHNGTARVALDETVALNDAVNGTLALLKELNSLDDTLVIVTSDHTHSLAINGYPARGNSILGIADSSKVDGVPYTTLSYTVVGNKSYHYSVKDGKVVRENPLYVNTTSFSYHQQGSILSDENKHGGGDVNVYATGPMAHLFHSVHEQTYVARVIAYAAKIGPHYSSSSATLPSLVTVLIGIVIINSLTIT
ncbi:alkaline phosphatase, tissue-nonspecific isozyme-like [Cimex lectularius]|uniref:Alkaline phosphatase n=1 Tax=Cimex lectularius TaxID=79782 RepID=A0A8I6RVA1_CIMLE|nr:alkaline phosphatase, tissue-nonspecific isozyme-like [Cimex lectularius]